MTEKKKPGLKKGQHKSNKIVLAKRVNHTEELLAKGLRAKDVIDTLRAEYGIVTKTAETYIHKALAKWEKESLEDEAVDLRLARRASMRIELKNLYEEARKDKNFKDCIVILDRMCKLDNLYAPDKVDVTIHQGVLVVPQVAATEAEWLSCTKHDDNED